MKLKITVEGKVYEVEVEVADSEPVHPHFGSTPAPNRAPVGGPSIAPPAASGLPAPVADEAKVCRSPIAGVVVRVTAQPGQAIQANDPLLVLEAMKMETVITSPVAGNVSRVNVNIGDAVQAGRVLVEFE